MSYLTACLIVCLLWPLCVWLRVPSSTLTFLKCINVSELFSHISVISVTPVMRMPAKSFHGSSWTLYSIIHTVLTMILLAEQRTCRWQEDLHQFGHTAYDTKRTQRCLFPYIRIGRLHQSLHLAGQITCHLWRCNGAQCAQRQSHNELCRAVQIAADGKGWG